MERILWRRIEAVITGRTRNQLRGNSPWVRVPPAPPGSLLWANHERLFSFEEENEQARRGGPACLLYHNEDKGSEVKAAIRLSFFVKWRRARRARRRKI